MKWILNLIRSIGLVVFGLVALIAIGALVQCFPREIEGGYKYASVRKCIVRHGSIQVPSEVLEYQFNDIYIRVKQVPLGPPRAMERGITYPQGRERVYYWLIIIPEKRTIGPLTKEQFRDSVDWYERYQDFIF